MGNDGEIRLMQGNEACAEAAIYADCRFFAGYPITPSSEIAEILSNRLPQVDGKFIQMEDEIASMAATIGASLTGRKSMTATSGPGFSLKQENLGLASLCEVPVVVVNVQRVGPSTGMPTSPSQGDVMQAKWGTHGDHPIIVLCPASVDEAFQTTIKAFNLAERYRVPVVLLLDEVIGHMREKVSIPDPVEVQLEERPRPQVSPDEYEPYDVSRSDVPPMADFGEGYRFHTTGLFHDKTGFPSNDNENADRLIKRLLRKIEADRDEIVATDKEMVEDAEVVVFAYGSTSRVALRAVREAREEGIRAGLLKPLTLWPFDKDSVVEACENARAVVVPEMNMGQLVREVERHVPDGISVHRLNKANGELFRPEEILAKIEEAV